MNNKKIIIKTLYIVIHQKKGRGKSGKVTFCGIKKLKI